MCVLKIFPVLPTLRASQSTGSEPCTLAPPHLKSSIILHSLWGLSEGSVRYLRKKGRALRKRELPAAISTPASQWAPREKGRALILSAAQGAPFFSPDPASGRCGNCLRQGHPSPLRETVWNSGRHSREERRRPGFLPGSATHFTH